MSNLEELAKKPLPDANELAGRFPTQPHDHKATEATYREVMEKLAFGQSFSDYMAHARWTKDGGWQEKDLRPYGPLPVYPGTSVLHYGQEVFEGLKAYRRADGTIWLFRPAFNANRFNQSARRMALPEIPVEDFVGSCVDLVRADARWVPVKDGATLYLRPFMYASESFLGVHPAHEVTYLNIGSPSGSYFKNGFSPVSIYVSEDYHRAGPGGTGEAKTSGNYAASLQPQEIAAEKGYAQVCFLDGETNTYIDELGGMNVFVVYRDGKVATPQLNGCILEGGTRGAIIQVLADEGITVSEERIALHQLLDDIRAGKVAEFLACGTAAVVTPIGKLGGKDFELEVPTGPMTKHLHDVITGIQWGRREDSHGWCYRVL
ncbi:branched-chain amino acid aminotransferase [Mobiluncus curtisii]|uniref:branched-chain-amino-acid transaminase n=1 Tax=Mobiluncus curtisii ATCC 51333 TaxID=887326 RepID=E6LYM8_9ACTO|nr:branched-chain amino acid aminotransferase [Mobiluncus curtisii]EFU80047.1 branched-chain-amino-acid transaminase [Mobiluncus curtisii ATCC 51333]